MLDKKTSSGTILASAFLASAAYGTTFPFLSARLEALQTYGYLIGLNAAMPALGWLLGSLILPWLQSRFETRAIIVSALLLAAVAWAGFSVLSGFWVWTGLRLVFGGAMGLFFRTVEFGLNASADPSARGKTFSAYNFAFGLGIAIGAAIQPWIGQEGYLPFAFVCGMICLAAWPAQRWQIEAKAHIALAAFKSWQAVLMVTPVPLIVGFCYGFLEDIPASLFSIYALRNGFNADIAAYTLTAAALGSVSLPLMLGRYTDRNGSRAGLVVAASGTMAFFILLPFAIVSPWVFLADIFLCCGFMASMYIVAMVMIGHNWSAKGLSIANATFGATYACGGLLGPVVNGAALDTLKSNGLAVSAACAALGVLVLALFAGAKHFVPARH